MTRPRDFADWGGNSTIIRGPCSSVITHDDLSEALEFTGQLFSDSDEVEVWKSDTDNCVGEKPDLSRLKRERVESVRHTSVG